MSMAKTPVRKGSMSHKRSSKTPFLERKPRFSKAKVWARLLTLTTIVLLYLVISPLWADFHVTTTAVLLMVWPLMLIMNIACMVRERSRRLGHVEKEISSERAVNCYRIAVTYYWLVMATMLLGTWGLDHFGNASGLLMWILVALIPNMIVVLVATVKLVGYAFDVQFLMPRRGNTAMLIRINDVYRNAEDDPEDEDEKEDESDDNAYDESNASPSFFEDKDSSHSYDYPPLDAPPTHDTRRSTRISQIASKYADDEDVPETPKRVQRPPTPPTFNGMPPWA